MAFSSLMLTTSGKTICAKAQQGKPLHFTRVAIGDGALGNGSMINRTELISERLSLLIDAIQLTNDSTEAAVTVTLKNDTITEGFYFREIALFAEDPDTHQELAYLYDNAGADGEYLPDGQGSVRVAEHLKLLIKLENTPQVTFVASGSPLYLLAEDIDDSSISKHSLWSSQKTFDMISGDIDCGTFDDATPLMLHDMSPMAHPLMVADGNAIDIAAESETLEAHMVDPGAHPNITLDGNVT